MAPRGNTQSSEVRLGVSECSASRRGQEKSTAAACGAERVGADVSRAQKMSADIRNEDMSWGEKAKLVDSSKVSWGRMMSLGGRGGRKQCLAWAVPEVE